MKAKNLSAEVHCHIKHSRRDMIIEMALIILTVTALCAVVKYLPELVEIIK